MPAEHEIRGGLRPGDHRHLSSLRPENRQGPPWRRSRFVPPFSFHRMTWIKPSFLWLMHRRDWGQKKQTGTRPRRQSQADGLGEGVVVGRPDIL